jgi:hypothetical protein
MLDNSTRKELIIDQIKAIGLSLLRDAEKIADDDMNLKIILRFEPDSLPTLEICKEKMVEL